MPVRYEFEKELNRLHKDIIKWRIYRRVDSRHDKALKTRDKNLPCMLSKKMI